MFRQSSSNSSTKAPSTSSLQQQQQQQQQKMGADGGHAMVGIFSEEAAETFRMMLQRGALNFIKNLYAYLHQKYPYEDQRAKRSDCFEIWENMPDDPKHQALKRREAGKLIERFPFLPNIYKIVASKYVKKLYDFLTEDRYVLKFSLPDFSLFYHRFVCALGQYDSVLDGDFVRSDFEDSRQKQVRDAIRDALQTCLVNNFRVLDKSLPPRSTASASRRPEEEEFRYADVPKSTVHWANVAPSIPETGGGGGGRDDDDDEEHVQQGYYDQHDEIEEYEPELPTPLEPLPPSPTVNTSIKKKAAFDWHALDIPVSEATTKTQRPSVNVRSAPPAYRTSVPSAPKMGLPPPTPSTVERFLNTPADVALGTTTAAAASSSSKPLANTTTSSSAELLRL